MPAIAIVGRKNVGKSTVFNRLIGAKLSIVYREPGVTRDRIYGEAVWRGRAFDVIDTGGFFPGEEIALATKIMRQIELALQEADLVYFIVDNRQGLTAIDEEIARSLRRLNKPVFLVINKVDTPREESKAWDFARLGLERTFPVSAEAGIGFGELLDATVDLLPRTRPLRRGKCVRVLILGRPNAGKSTLLNSIIQEERAIVDEQPGTTRDLVNARFDHQGQTLELIDTCGFKRRSRIREPIELFSAMRAIRVIDDADVVVLIFDLTQGVVAEDKRITALVLAKAKCLVITPNKIDRINRKKLGKIINSTQQSFDYIDFAPIIPISAKDRTNIERLLNTILAVHAEAAKVADREVLGSLAKRLKSPSYGEVVKLVQTGTRPPIFRLTVSKPVKEHYLKYVRHEIRNYFGYRGVPILIKTQLRVRT
jgi:GTP-binding protein